ncbi:predicted protein [Nematostella vectensis]|uniref:Uncharacterized protein n=1 Tax=Nematostella vectensis TaxID=45351 RepID=A7SCB3_NEMVE|nr:predicted protein [Nematostella vectensis]|eukprot:XP_001630694.1 predicted protein [Nematostella vectensis]
MSKAFSAFLVFFASAFVLGIKSDSAPLQAVRDPRLSENGSLSEKIFTRHGNHSRVPMLFISFSIIKTNTSNGTTDREYMSSPELLMNGREEVAFFNKEGLRVPRLGEMRSLYFIASACLFILFLMVIKLIVSRRGTKDYALVTKGDFDA